MKSIQTRVGEVTCHPDKVVHFPEGLIGFERLKDFIVLPKCGRTPCGVLINPGLFTGATARYGG